jgi:hypothetical protein
MSDNRDIAYAFLGFGFGIWYFFKGFKYLHRKRIVENIPTSTIRSLALGLIELNGKAKKAKLIKSPVTNTDCVYYRYKVERYEGKHWTTVAQGNSDDCAFLLDDGSGSITVLPGDAELIMPANYEFETGISNQPHSVLKYFLEANSIKYKGLLGTYPTRCKEWCIRPDENIYVLGTAKKINDSLDMRKEKLMKRISELKDDSAGMAEVDLDKDGKISSEEWDMAVAKIEQKLLEEELKFCQADDLANVAISKGDEEETFIISNYSQKDLIKKLFWQSFSGVFGGAVLSLAALAYLLFRFNIF